MVYVRECPLYSVFWNVSIKCYILCTYVFCITILFNPFSTSISVSKKKKEEKIGQIENKVTFIEIAIRTKIVWAK